MGDTIQSQINITAFRQDDHIEIQYRTNASHFRRQILIVDDEPFNIKAAKIVLEFRNGVKNIDKIYDSAMNGQEAL